MGLLLPTPTALVKAILLHRLCEVSSGIRFIRKKVRSCFTTKRVSEALVRPTPVRGKEPKAQVGSAIHLASGRTETGTQVFRSYIAAN